MQQKNYSFVIEVWTFNTVFHLRFYSFSFCPKKRINTMKKFFNFVTMTKEEKFLPSHVLLCITSFWKGNKKYCICFSPIAFTYQKYTFSPTKPGSLRVFFLEFLTYTIYQRFTYCFSFVEIFKFASIDCNYWDTLNL